jgi:hypothetical protein
MANGKKADHVKSIFEIGRLGCGQDRYVNVDPTVQLILRRAGGTVATSIA